MSTGTTLYLVSACGTAEEFVAAFRRYADRTGVFVPTATPLPAGRRARIALTLRDGGVMVEGDADVVQSSMKPTVLQGRPGMTVKFVAPDDPSKTVLAELEKARLALKPAAPSVSPRPAEIPAEPRPTAPPVGGRIDASNALAECVVIGDASNATTASPATALSALPAIAPRPATASTPPPAGAAGPRAKPMTIPPISAGIPAPAAISQTAPTVPTARPRTVSVKPTSIGMPILDKPPAMPSPALAGVVTEDESTVIGEMPPRPPAAPTSSGGIPRVGASFETQPVGSARVAPPVPDARTPVTPTGRAKPVTRPPLQPRHPTPVAPVPIVRPPAKRAPVDDAVIESAIVEEENTDLTQVPPISGERTAVTEVPVPPADVTPSEPVDALASTHVGDKPQRSGGMRASEIMAAIPTGDWTMAPDAPEPTRVPADAPPAPSKGPPTGNWTISLDPETGWGEPQKLEAPAVPPPVAKPPPRARQASSGNPTIAVAKDEGFVAVAWEDKPTHVGDKIEIDAALMGEVAAAAAAPTPPPPVAAPPLPRAPIAPIAASPSDGVARIGVAPHADYSGAAALPRRKKQPAWLFPVGAVTALAAGFGLVMLLAGGKKSKPSAAKTPAKPVPAVVATPSPDAAVVEAVAPTPPPVEPEPAPTAPVAAGPCKVAVASTPAGATVFVGADKVGTTPAELELPCGVEAKLSIKKASYTPATRAFTPIDGKANKVAVKLAKPTLTVKVTSSPPGAAITVGGKSMGVTPATVRLPANETAELVLTKPGFAVARTSVTPKSNNTSTNVTLKKGRR